jgi:hypothetical protein
MDDGRELGELADEQAVKVTRCPFFDVKECSADRVCASHQREAVLRDIQIAAIVLTALAMAPALAHAFEFPGKRRLDESSYVGVQAIYYPGFTLLGIAEPAALFAIAVLLFFTPRDRPAFLLTALALVCMFGMQTVYWMITHPTNKYWVTRADTTLGKAGTRFFAAGSAPHATRWTKMRNRWEYSHIARAALSFVAFLLVTLSAVLFA